MNVNLTPATDSAKATKVAGEVVDSSNESSEVTEGEGFLAKLASLILGDKKAGKESVENHDVKTEATTKSGEVIDALLDGESSDDGTPISLSAKAGSAADSVKNQSDVDSDVDAADPKAKVDTEKFDTAKVFDEGDELLAKLNDATESLRGKNGNNLPVDELAKLKHTEKSAKDGLRESSKGAVEPVAEQGAVWQQFGEAAQPLKKGEQAAKEGTSAEDIKSAQQVLPSDGKHQPHVGQNQAVDMTQLTQAQEKQGQSATEKLAPNQQSVSPALQGKGSELLDGQAKAENVDELAALPQWQQGKASLVKGEQTPLPLKDKGQVDPRQISVPNLDQQVVASNGVGVKSQKASETQAAVSASVLPTNVPVPMEELVHGKQAPVLKHGHDQVAQLTPQALHQLATSQSPADRALAQQLSAGQALDASQTNAQSLASQVAMPMTVNMPNQQVSSHAALRSAMGAKMVAGLAADKRASEHKDAGLAGQLAGAAGQQQTGAATQSLRAEAAQGTNTPLHLTRDAAGDQVAEKVHMMMSKNLKNIDIRLDPPELGRMQIRLHMNGDGAGVHFTVANHQARDMIEQSMPRLREMLSQQGVQLGDTSVQQQSSGQQQGYAAQGGDGSNVGSGPLGAADDENLEAGVNLDVNVSSARDGISYYA